MRRARTKSAASHSAKRGHQRMGLPQLGQLTSMQAWHKERCKLLLLIQRKLSQLLPMLTDPLANQTNVAVVARIGHLKLSNTDFLRFYNNPAGNVFITISQRSTGILQSEFRGWAGVNCMPAGRHIFRPKRLPEVVDHVGNIAGRLQELSATRLLN